MATYRMVVPDTQEEQIKKTLRDKFGGAEVRIEKHEDFLGMTWKEAVIEA